MSRHVLPGDPLEVDAYVYNAAVDLYQSRQRGAAGVFTRFLKDPTIVLVRNGSGTDFPLFGVVGLSAIEIDPDTYLDNFLESFAFTGLVPDLETHPAMSYRWGIAQEPIPVGEYGSVRVDGLSHCFIKLPDGEDVDFVGPETGNVQSLVQADCGARVFYRHAGIASQRGIIVL